MQSERQHAGVLARAVVVKRCKVAAGANHRVRRRSVVRWVDPTIELAGEQPQASQHRTDDLDLCGRTVVGSAAHRELRGAETVRLGHAIGY
jgi:hypothetical protein